MRSNFFVTAAIASLFAGAAFAQSDTATTPAPTTEAPAATTEAPAATDAPAATTEAPAATDAPAATTAAPGVTEEAAVVVDVPEGFVVAAPTDYTADQLKGVNVYDTAGAKVADIKDVQVGANNAVDGVIVDVGGFLGIGAHQVLIPMDKISIYKNPENEFRAFVTATKDELKALPEYKAP